MLVLSGCASGPQSDQLLRDYAASPGGSYSARELERVPFYPQSQYQCGPAALATLMVDTGLDVSPADLVSAVYVPGRKGSLQAEMLAATRKQQLIPVAVEPRLAALLSAIDAGKPVLVMQNLGLDLLPRWHYAVVIGYDLQAAELVLRSGETRRRVTSLPVFENTWRRTGYWGFVALVPGEMPPFVSEQRYLSSLSDFLQQAGEETGVKAAIAGVEQWPENALMRMMLAEAYVSAGAAQRAESVYRELLQRNPRFAPAHNNLAMLLFAGGQHQEALVHARRAVDLGGRHVDEYRQTLSTIVAGQ